MYLSEYCALVVLVSGLVSFLELISYSGGKEKGERLAVSVILIYLVISPLVPLVESAKDFDISEILKEEQTLSGGAYLDVGENAFRDGIGKLLFEKWGIEENESVISVIGFDFNSMRAERIIITLLSKGVFSDFHEIESYIEKMGLGKCEVRYAV